MPNIVVAYIKEDKVAPYLEALAAVGRVHALEQCVLGVDFQDRQALRCRLPGLLEHARQVRAHVVLVDHDAGR